MKKQSIKTRVTIWYVFFLVIVVLLLFSATIYTSNQLIQKDRKDDLSATVIRSVRDVDINNGKLEIDDDMISYRDGIYILVYKENNFIVTGTLPEGVEAEIPFISGQVRKIADGGKEFYVYDYLINDDNYQDVWVRGITTATLTESDPAIAFMVKLFLVLLPLLIILAALGGYFITKRAFAPVSAITKTAHDISNSKDLSRRLNFDRESDSKDEIYDLAFTFDNMLNRLESSFTAEKQFSDNASHELRTPISVILAQCEYAIDKAETLDEAKESLEIILGQSKKMSLLVSQLLMLARADRGNEMLHFETLNLSEIIEMVVMELEVTAADQKISLKTDLNQDIFVESDQTMITQVFINLISNGIKYGKEGGTVTIRLTQYKDQAVCEIIDDGIGIAPENLIKIWDRFYQVDPARSMDSLGLGLSMAKWIIAAHNGEIKVQSRIDEGTTFTVSIPIKMEEK